MTKTGLARILETPPEILKNRRIGLLANPASIGPDYRHARDLILEAFPGQLAALYSPQHGFFAEKQDNMIESDHITDPETGLPVFSLYGEVRKPTPGMLDSIDVLVIDIQDVGCRVYTFIYTMSYCMEAARDAGIPVVVLDRPNPVGGTRIEGNLLDPDVASFVGRYPIPMRHGLTTCELARLFNTHFGIGCDLHVIPMDGWERSMQFEDTGLPWVLPSPNMPTPETARVYPGQVIWEATNLSEARGTTRPFELFGAPFLDPDAVLARIPQALLAGCVLRKTIFEPTSGKWAKIPCRGFQIHVTDPEIFRSYPLSVAFLAAIRACHPEDFQWKMPPYEYEFEKLPMDLVLGSAQLRAAIEDGADVLALSAQWKEAEIAFARTCRDILLYPAAGDFLP